MRIYARLDDGRWIGDCPDPGCQSASLLAKGRKRMKCPCPPSRACAHGGVCDKRWDIVWPDNLAEIEKIVMARPAKDGRYTPRNWTPGETLELLVAENLEHGVM